MSEFQQSERQRQRKQMSDDIVLRVREAIREELAGAPKTVPATELEKIEQTILDHTQQVVQALNTEEMQSERALLNHIANARWEAQRSIRERSRKTK